MNTIPPSQNEGNRPSSASAEPACEMAQQRTSEDHSGAAIPDQKHGYQMVGAGFELAGFTIIPALIGLAIDRWIQSETAYLSAFGSLFGFIAGMIHFIRQANSLQTPNSDKHTKQ